MLHCLPAGSLTEIYFHPATRQSPLLQQLMPDYEPQAELAALLSPEIGQYLHDQAIVKGRFCDFTSR
jgi:hypothetical protein